MKAHPVIVVCLATAAVATAVVVVVRRRLDHAAPLSTLPAAAASSARASTTTAPGPATVPSTPAAGTAAIGQSADPTSLATGHAAAVPSLDFGGRAVAIAGDSNAAVHAVSVAAQAHARPELRSIDVEAPAFDRIAYEHDPVGYCAEAVPARCFQAAQPHRDVPVLRCASANYTRIDQDQSCALRVRAPAGAPVSLTSLDLGTFQNGLTAITVRADADGLAEATFSAGPGTINDVHILAGCPLASGQVRFVVNVTPSALAQVRSR